MKLKNIISSLALVLFFFSAIAQDDSPGCTDPMANNYSTSATWDDGSCCYMEHFVTFSSDQIGQAYVVGTNSADNYEYYYFPGTYTYCVPAGCYVTQLYNYEFQDFLCTLSIDGGEPIQILASELNGLQYSFSLGEITLSGCNDPGACNYDPAVTCNDGSCAYDCLGCTDSNAPNFNPTATTDDGSCCELETWYVLEANGPCYASFYSETLGFLGGINYPEQVGVCLPVSCVQMNLQVASTLEPLIFSLVNNAGNVVASGEFSDNFYYETYIAMEGAVIGCGDPYACNYDPTATCFDNSTCDLTCYGCTNPDAPNFDPSASVDDGSCCSSENWLTILVDQDASIAITTQYYQNYFYGVFYLTAGIENHICLPDGCYLIDVTSAYFNTETSFVITDFNGNELASGTSANGIYQGELSKNGVVGCLLPEACNYNPNATCYDYTICDYSCYGCTDPAALNYNENATIDNGTCCMEELTVTLVGEAQWSISSSANYVVYSNQINVPQTFCAVNGCYYMELYSFGITPSTLTVTDSQGNIVATLNSGEIGYATLSFGYNDIAGCTDLYACNYNPDANCHDYSCVYDCFGCTDPSAPNYNPDATVDNGSCCTNSWYTIETSEPAYWSAYTLGWYSIYNSGASPEQNGFCMDSEECFAFSVYSTFPTSIAFTIYAEDGSVFYSGTTDETGWVNVVFNQSDVYGCTDINACNYDPLATCTDWYACDYSCFGCTNSLAGNYDPTATIDDGTCCVTDWYTVEMDNAGFWYVSNGMNYSSGGDYTALNGFCGFDGCFTFHAYSMLGDVVNFTVTNQEGEVVLSGSTGDGSYYSGSVGQEGEVSGCTDSYSCNYNPDATCEDGSCNYYCGGCSDVTALNYNASAWFDDGSCFYTVESPMLQLDVESDPFQEVYYVRMEMMNLGNGAPYLLSADLSTELMMIDENGQYIIGPFPCGEDVVINLNSAQLGMMEYMVSDPLSGDCAIVASVDEVNVSTLAVYPNPTEGDLTLSGLQSGNVEVEIFDMTGRTVFSKKQSLGSSSLNFVLTDLQVGAYVLKVNNNGIVSSEQLMIVR
jgi:hypothetical protein